MDNRSGNVIIQVDITLKCEDGNDINTKCSSKCFLEHYILTGNLPVGTKAKHFDSFDVEDKLYESLEKVTNYINNRCKFRIIGWVKRGEVQDQGVDQPSNGLPHNAARVLIQSGTLNHHITRIDLMKPESIEIGHLDTLKFDAKTAFTKNEDDNYSANKNINSINNMSNTRVDNNQNKDDNCKMSPYSDKDI